MNSDYENTPRGFLFPGICSEICRDDMASTGDILERRLYVRCIEAAGAAFVLCLGA